MMATGEPTPPANPQQQPPAGTPAGVASSARASLKRARVLFDTGAAPRSGSACHAALVPPVDRSLHKAAVARRVRAHYPVVPSDGAAAAGDDDEDGGKSKGGSASTSLTAQVLAELRQETARRIVRGEAAGTDAGVGAGAGGGVAGQIVLHREVDLGIAGTGGGAAAAGTAAAAGGGVLALPGQKVQAVGSAEEGGDASGTVRPGGILAVSRATIFLCYVCLIRDPMVVI